MNTLGIAVPFLDLGRVNKEYHLDKIAKKVIDSGNYLWGGQVSSFEKELANYVGSKYAICVGSGLDALRFILLGYKAMGKIKEGDGVIVPANTYIATILPILECGFVPEFIEPDINTYNLDPLCLKVTKKTRAMFVVHLYGRPCWSEKIAEFSRNNNLIVIEDNAQALGAGTGNLGDASATSFYPSKNLGGLGDGGAVATNNKSLADIVRALGNYGKESGVNYYKGFNSRMDELQAAFLSVKLPFLNERNKKRRQIAERYVNEIKGVVLPRNCKNHVWHLFTIRTKQRDELKRRLFNKGVATAIHYPIPPHKQPALNFSDFLPITEKIHQEILSLPLYPEMTEEEISYVIKSTNDSSFYSIKEG